MFDNEIISDCKKALLDDLIEIEQEYGFVFPEEFKLFYTRYNGGKPKKREVYLQDGEWNGSTRFHGFYSVKTKFENVLRDVYYEKWWAKGLIPFGYDEGGETFCFSTRDKDYGCIYIFFSDSIDDEDPEYAYLKVSNNLIQFINEME